MTYVPYKGGGDVAVQLVGKHVDSTVNNPIEAVAHWRSGALRPLCVFDNAPMPYPAKVTATQSWQDIPTCKSQGIDMEYLMLRGIFMAPGVTQEQVDYFVDVFKKVRETARVEEVHRGGRLQQHVHDGQAVRRLGGEGRRRAQGADAGSRLHRQVRKR